jgi:hypothetical protein
MDATAAGWLSSTMIPCVRAKPGTTFYTIAPGGFALIAAIHHTAQVIGHDLTITSGTDGTHSGPDDPHHTGNAYDVRISDLPDHELALKTMQDFLGPLFFVWIEDEGTPNQHIHCQVKKGTIYPPEAT